MRKRRGFLPLRVRGNARRVLRGACLPEFEKQRQGSWNNPDVVLCRDRVANCNQPCGIWLCQSAAHYSTGQETTHFSLPPAYPQGKPERAQTGLSHQLLFSSVSVTPTASIKRGDLFFTNSRPRLGSYTGNLKHLEQKLFRQLRFSDRIPLFVTLQCSWKVLADRSPFGKPAFEYPITLQRHKIKLP